MVLPSEEARRRFVILEHNHPFLHWDLLMERDGALASWRLLQPVVCGQWIDAEVLPDHRMMYLDYEGPVSRDRGSVKRIAGGTFRQLTAVTGPTDSTTTSFELADCELAMQAMLRTRTDCPPQWRFE
ncbi:DNA polymerase ligase N-terminal domain-containing protein [Fuerstiella marisgermanici]|uniref:DNA polymerase ligase N-terminal domain-containing protein n=1 Tax=Fuerstiella marisgermanici TaxID=1891926 RepID=UPI00097BC7F8|nr:DNA polymerase ligase N-terminal domain-containing protein [Fuerstiella marisgermanici]